MQLGALDDHLLDAIIDQIDGGGRDQRPNDTLVILGIAGKQRLGARGELF